MSDLTYAINLLDPDFYQDPWDSYRWLRDHSPVHWDAVQKVWGISRYADISAIEKNPALYSSVPGSRPLIDQSAETSTINQDDPLHQTQRNLVARRFTPRAVRNREDQVRELAASIVDDVADLGSCEAVEAIASRLPAMTIGEMIGYPRELWPKVREWSEVTMLAGGSSKADGSGMDHSSGNLERAINEFAAETLPIISARRADPQDDLISVWTHALEPHGRLWSEEEVLAETILVLDGGAETSRTVMGSIIRELALQPDQRRILVERPEVLKETGVEEFIRWVSPILNMRRTATADHDLHGQAISAGDQLLLMYSSGNRDERAFEDPDRFDVTRAHNHHVAFGFGTHFCLGASLARLEIRVMFEEMLRRIPDWRLVPGTEPRIVPSTFARGYDAIHIEY